MPQHQRFRSKTRLSDLLSFGLPRAHNPAAGGDQEDADSSAGEVSAVAVQQVMLATLFGAGVVVCGGGYALLLALSRAPGLKRRARGLAAGSLLCYGLLLVCVGALCWALSLAGWWLALAALICVGYFVAPRFIWRLSSELHS